MAGRRSKTGIPARLRAEREDLERLLATLGPERMLEAGVVARSSVKDVLAHLGDWEVHPRMAGGPGGGDSNGCSGRSRSVPRRGTMGRRVGA